jgi:hypothetical protein
MRKFSTSIRNRLNIRHWCACLLMIGSVSIAQEPKLQNLARKPASYIPNDDVIVVPVDAEMSFYDKHFINDPKFSKNSNVQRQIKIWQENELMAQQYGLDTQSAGSLYFVPTNEEKFKLIERSYFRYLKKKGEDPFKEGGEEIIQGWTASDELDSIDEMEAAFRATSNKTRTGVSLPKSLREKQVAKTKKFRFNIQPRPEQGMLIVRISGPIDARAWVGINGEAEMNVQKTFDQTGTRIQGNYFVHDGRSLASIDQNLGYPGLRARIINTRKPIKNRTLTDSAFSEDTRFQLIYGTDF